MGKETQVCRILVEYESLKLFKKLNLYLWRSADGNGSKILGVQVIGQWLRMRSVLIPTMMNDIQGGADLLEMATGRRHLHDRDPDQGGVLLGQAEAEQHS